MELTRRIDGLSGNLWALLKAFGWCLAAVWAVGWQAAASTLVSENVRQMVQILSLSGHTGYVRDVAFSPDGEVLASIGDDRVVRL